MITDTLKRFVGKLFGQRSTGMQRIGRDKHGIDRRNVSRHAIKVCEVLQHEGYQAYIVGGAVRDLIVGLEPKILTWQLTPRLNKCAPYLGARASSADVFN